MSSKTMFIARSLFPEDGEGFGIYKVTGYGRERPGSWTGMGLAAGPFDTLEEAIEVNRGMKERIVRVPQRKLPW